MIQFDAVSKVYGSDSILDSISFVLGKRERVALVGRNGAGKTTLFRLITGKEEADSGSITVPKGYKVGHLSQHIHFTKETVLDEACLGLKQEEQDKIYKAESILFGLGFTEADMAKSPSLFSGGYHLRLHLAKLLLSEPDCLLLDEPTNYLDILSIRWLSKYLRSWQGECIVVSHDRLFLDEVSTHTMAIHRKKLKKVEGGTEKLFTQIAAEEEVHEKTRQALDKKKAHLQSFIDRFGAKNTKAAQAQSRAKAIKRMPSLEALCQIEDLQFTFPAAKTNSKILVKADDIGFGYTTPLITNFSLEIEKDARLGIIGQNGKGKSTLLKLLSGDLVPQAGQIIRTQGIDIGYFGQSHIERLHKENSVEDEIRCVNPDLTVEEIRSICGKMMFTQARAEKKIGVLSGGERSRVVLGKLLARPCHLLLLDEPTNHLDVESMEAFMDALDEFEGAVCIVTHSELVLERLATKLVVFQNSTQNHFWGGYLEFLEKGGWSEEERASPKKEQSQKETRRQRADLVQERSKALKPHQKQAEELEKKIIDLEKKVEENNKKLLDAIQQGKSLLIGDLSKQIKEHSDEIDRLFSELEVASQKIEEIKQEFSQKS